MELKNYLPLFRKRWLSIVIVTLLMIAAAGALMLLTTPRYTATTRMFFGVQSGESVTDLAQGSTFAEKQMSSYAQVATSPLVLDPVIDRVGLPVTASKLASNVVATPPADTVILEISVTDTDPQRAANIANAIGDQLAIVAGGLSPARPDGTESVKATLLAAASPPASPSSPNVLRNLAVAGVLGLVVGVGVALIRQATDTKIRSEQDVQALTDATILGAVAFDETVAVNPIVMRSGRFTQQSEALRRIRTNLQFVNIGNKHPTILISSSIPGEGKSTTALNLAVALSDAGVRTILIDADLRRPSIARYMGLEGQVGLTTVLIGKAEVVDVVQPWENGMLDILPAGQIPPNPSELLGSSAMRELLTELAEVYDMVLIDSPPLLPVTDAAVLSRFASGTLVVVGADRIHAPQLRTALSALKTVESHVIGVVVNKIARKDSTPYSYGYGYESDGPIEDSAASALGALSHEPEVARPDTSSLEHETVR